jgi:hypothetical protein
VLRAGLGAGLGVSGLGLCFGAGCWAERRALSCGLSWEGLGTARQRGALLRLPTRTRRCQQLQRARTHPGDSLRPCTPPPPPPDPNLPAPLHSPLPTRAPEKYSSAAPLAADARQRICSEFIDPRNSVTVSVSVGPPSGLLKDKRPSEWK